MNGTGLLTPLARRGLLARPVGDGKLRVWPSARLTDDLRNGITEHKAALLALLELPAAAIVGVLAGFLAREGNRQEAELLASNWRCVRYDLLVCHESDGIDDDMADGLALERLLVRLLMTGRPARVSR